MATTSGLGVALLAYRVRGGRDDGLFLRFGGLDDAELRTGVAQLVADVRRTRRSRNVAKLVAPG